MAGRPRMGWGGVGLLLTQRLSLPETDTNQHSSMIPCHRLPALTCCGHVSLCPLNLLWQMSSYSDTSHSSGGLITVNAKNPQSLSSWSVRVASSTSRACMKLTHARHAIPYHVHAYMIRVESIESSSSVVIGVVELTHATPHPTTRVRALLPLWPAHTERAPRKSSPYLKHYSHTKL